ncbi:hypothetical protein E2C01_050979 [Portunus trituberculatus]|uniref:Uncharacterized protein n=1 Tax=Portunus trituberculatus TaxID=210409 RepID=A0A5B7GAE1_PORTR|nr:hypothetical protein [Portunus trituberculatus]
MGKNGGGKLSQWAKIKIVCKVVRGKLQKAHTMGYLTVPGQEVKQQVCLNNIIFYACYMVMFCVA